MLKISIMGDYILSEDLQDWFNKKITIKETVLKEQMSENLKYHLDNKISLTENVFRYGSDKYFHVII